MVGVCAMCGERGVELTKHHVVEAPKDEQLSESNDNNLLSTSISGEGGTESKVGGSKRKYIKKRSYKRKKRLSKKSKLNLHKRIKSMKKYKSLRK